MTEASENVWGTALPYLVAVDSSTDLNADNYLYTVQFTAEQMQQALTGLGLLPDPAAPASWFGEAALTSSGYVASLPVCGQSVTGPALRKALGLRSACFTVQYQEGSFLLTTKGYGHGVGLSQWGAKRWPSRDRARRKFWRTISRGQSCGGERAHPLRHRLRDATSPKVGAAVMQGLRFCQELSLWESWTRSGLRG